MKQRVTLINYTTTTARIGAFLLSSLTICTICTIACIAPVAVGAVGAGYREPIASVNVKKQVTTYEVTYSHYARGAVVALIQVEAAQRISRNDCRGVVTRADIQTKKPRLKSVGITY